MNKITIVGNLGNDPERRSYTDRNNVEQPIATFSVAVSKRNRDADPDWFNVKVFGPQAQPCLDHLAKGRQVAVHGRMESNKGTGDHEGKTFWDLVADEVQFLGTRPEGQASGQANGQAQPTAAASGTGLPF